MEAKRRGSEMEEEEDDEDEEEEEHRNKVMLSKHIANWKKIVNNVINAYKIYNGNENKNKTIMGYNKNENHKTYRLLEPWGIK